MLWVMTKLMAVLNVTPDSYFTHFPHHTDATQQGKLFYDQGADIIDIGGESSRPGAALVSAEEELRRVIPVIKALSAETSIPLSIDTCKAVVADAAVKAGVSLINDIGGFRDPAMQEVAASAAVDLCVMHMQGTPQTMQINPTYPDGVITEIQRWLEKQVSQLIKRGVKEKHIIIDPGIGFGKTVDHNLEILQNLPQLKGMGFRLLLGVSRKSFMAKILGLPTSDLLPTTIALNTLLIQSGMVDIIRVHDVAQHRTVVDFLKHLRF